MAKKSLVVKNRSGQTILTEKAFNQMEKLAISRIKKKLDAAYSRIADLEKAAGTHYDDSQRLRERYEVEMNNLRKQFTDDSRQKEIEKVGQRLNDRTRELKNAVEQRDELRAKLDKANKIITDLNRLNEANAALHEELEKLRKSESAARVERFESVEHLTGPLRKQIQELQQQADELKRQRDRYDADFHMAQERAGKAEKQVQVLLDQAIKDEALIEKLRVMQRPTLMPARTPEDQAKYHGTIELKVSEPDPKLIFCQKVIQAVRALVNSENEGDNNVQG